MTQTTELFDAIKNNDINKCKLFLKQGANVNEKDNDGDTPLHNAIKILCFELTIILIKANANLHIKNYKNMTPLECVLLKYNKLETELNDLINKIKIYDYFIRHANYSPAILKHLKKTHTEHMLDEINNEPLIKKFYDSQDNKDLDKFYKTVVVECNKFENIKHSITNHFLKLSDMKDLLIKAENTNDKTNFTGLDYLDWKDCSFLNLNHYSHSIIGNCFD